MLISSILQAKGTHVVTIAPSVVVTDAARALTSYGVGALVVSNDGEHIAGIISERDIARAVGRDGPSTLDREVRSLMTTNVTTCRLGDTVDHLMEMMTAHRIRHLPVIDGPAGKLVGIVSIGDVVKHRLSELQTETRTLHEYIALGR